MPNYYNTSSGEKISQATIDARRSKTYRLMYEGEAHPCCAGCGKRAQGSAHLCPQSVCKSLGKSEYCYMPINIVAACYSCNQSLENPRSEAVRHLMCFEELLRVTEIISPERYLKMIL